MKLAPLVLTIAALASATPRAVRAAPPSEHSARHILVAYKGAERSAATRTRDEAKALATRAFDAVRAGRAFADASHEWSDDKNADRRDGFLDIFTAERMDPRFYAAVVGAKVGEVVGPVESNFGFHVIERLSIEDAVAIKARDICVVRGAFFAFKGSKTVQDGRTRELALEDASRALTQLSTVRAWSRLRPEIGARSFPDPDGRPKMLRRGRLSPGFEALEAAAFGLKVGEMTTRAIETPIGWVLCERLPYFRFHLAQLVVLHKDAPEGTGRGILRTKEEARSRAALALSKLRADPSAWPAVVLEFSDDAGSARSEGLLPGSVEPGTAVLEEFERAAANLGPGAISDLVESRFGWHVVRRYD